MFIPNKIKNSFACQCLDNVKPISMLNLVKNIHVSCSSRVMRIDQLN